MRFIVKSLTVAMCGAAILAFGVARAGEAQDAATPGFRVIEADARIPSTRSVTGYEVVDNDTLLLKVGIRDLYLAELSGTCGRSLRFEWTLGIDARGGGAIDRFSRVIANGRSCAITSLDKVERMDAEAGAEAAAPNERVR